jgi:hypothetical protein
MFLYAASFLSTSAQECSKAFHLKGLFNGIGLGDMFGTVQQQQACAGVITGFLGGLGQISEAGIALQQACSWLTGSRRISNTSLDALSGGGSKDQLQAECAMDIVTAVTMLSRAGQSINMGTYSCEEKKGTSKEEAHCGYDISNVIMSFSWVANAISLATTHCSMLLEVDSICAGSVTNLLSGLADLAAMGSGIQAKCPMVDKAVNGLGNTVGSIFT